MKQFEFKQPVATNGKVDFDAGIITGVSLISTPEAKGHNIKIDAQTIQSFYDAVDGQSIKAYYRHDPENDALSTIGLWTEFKIVEDEEYTKLTANFVALDSWRENHADQFQALFELAEKAPEAFGVSAEFLAKQIVYGKDGEELEWDGESDDDVFARAVEVNAFSIVAQPSANPTGLFSVPTEVEKGLVEATHDLQTSNNALEMDLNTANAQLKVFEKQLGELEAEKGQLVAQIEELQTQLEQQAEQHKSVVQDMGGEPVVATPVAKPQTFEEKIANATSWLEKAKLYNDNMPTLVANWNKQ